MWNRVALRYRVKIALIEAYTYTQAGFSPFKFARFLWLFFQGGCFLMNTLVG